jgi:hypothetical protein
MNRWIKPRMRHKSAGNIPSRVRIDVVATVTGPLPALKDATPEYSGTTSQET